MARAGEKSVQWVVEALGESTATVEVDGQEMAKVPRWLLPAGAREGDVLAVTHERGAERASLTVVRDPDATKAALAASERQMRDAPVDKKGGDITL
jgi:hypothetical protein